MTPASTPTNNADRSAPLRIIGYDDNSLATGPGMMGRVQVFFTLSRPLSEHEQFLVDNAERYGYTDFSIEKGSRSLRAVLRPDELSGALSQWNAELATLQNDAAQHANQDVDRLNVARGYLEELNFE